MKKKEEESQRRAKSTGKVRSEEAT